MDGHISFSRKERYQHFFYLLLLIISGIIILSFIFLRKRASPFNNKLSFEMQMLQQGKQYVQQEKIVFPFIQKTFKKIDQVPLQQMQAFSENDIKNDINDIANISNDAHLNDPRKECFLQIALFYKMFLEDKKIAGKKAENIVLFEKQFTECSIGFKDKEQQMAQKNAAIAARTAQQ